MGVLSEEYIMQRLNKYANSKTGKKRIAQYRRELFNGGRGGAGSLARERVDQILQDVCEGFINAVMSVIVSFRGDAVHTSDWEMDNKGCVRATVYVDEDALRRESLHYVNQNMSIGHGEGIDDILALFTHGYTIDKRPYGFWVRDNVMADIDNPLTRIGALMHREPNPFLTEFVDRINTQYSGVCEVTLNDKYKNKGGG